MATWTMSNGHVGDNGDNAKEAMMMINTMIAMDRVARMRLYNIR